MTGVSRTKAGKPPSAVELIMQHNRGREAERLAIKYRIMRSSPFAFLRGTSHLFHQRLVEAGIAPDGPPVWSSGDQHLENFGSYLGDNGLAYFDLNDFDAAMLAPAPWDILRLVTSLMIAAPTLHMRRPEVNELGRSAAEVWRETLASGKAGWVERRTAEGIIGTLLTGLRKRNQVAFLNSRSTMKKGVRSLKDDGTKMLPMPEKDKEALRKWLRALANGQREREFFNLVDAARRVAGVASMGALRYALLVEGTGSPDGNLLFDLKSAQSSAAAPYSPCKQPDWPNEAVRIVEVQKRCEAVPPDYLQAVTYMGEACILKQLQPSQDRLDLVEASRHLESFSGALHTMAQLSAWAHLRSSGRQGSATADELIAFAGQKEFGRRLLDTAHQMEAFVLADWKAFCVAYDAGKIGAATAK